MKTIKHPTIPKIVRKVGEKDLASWLSAGWILVDGEAAQTHSKEKGKG